VRAWNTLASAAESGKASEPPSRIRVLVVDGPDRGTIRATSGTRAAIGTSNDNEVVLTDPTVSRYHLELGSGDGIALRDLGSKNGTFINDVRIGKAVVPTGSVVRLGASVLRLLDGGPVTHLPEPAVPRVPGLVAASPAMQEVCRAIRVLAPSNVSVLLQGETGTGKEVVARAIHQASDRAGGPFVVVDCGALASTLIASQLFGHERGAFTGADRRQEGAFEAAMGGSIFLDEIGELQLPVQPALLGVLERRSFRRLGGKVDIPSDVRVIAATNRDLRAEVNHGTFRADLYFRLAGARICIPPLRERREDIEPLIEAFAEQAISESGSPFSHATMEALRSHRWSGNVRELRNVVESALALGHQSLTLEGSESVATAASILPYQRARGEVIAAFERAYLSRIMKQANANVAAAARLASMARSHLVSLLEKHGFPP
jgi:DNA-binding NtrC family response regulator